MTHDEKYMRIALDLARRGRGSVEPNPMVGAVIVKDGKIIGKGYHEKFGGPHAEINAIQSCQSAAGATLYVTLEPCSRQGKTPPCVNAAIESGIARVFLGAKDPTQDPGIQKLRAAGIEVIEGVLEKEATKLVAPFLKLRTKGEPYVIAKWAMTLDGKIATRTGDSRWISGHLSRDYVHHVRSQVDAIIVGVETVIKDDPRLTCRIPNWSEGDAVKNPMRIVLDTAARIPLDSHLVSTARRIPTLVTTTPKADPTKLSALKVAGCEIMQVQDLNGRVDLKQLMKCLGQRDLTYVFIEGGSEVLASAFDTRIVDEVMVFVAPKIIGGLAAKSPLSGVGIEEISSAIAIEDVTLSRFEDDVLVEGYVQYNQSSGSVRMRRCGGRQRPEDERIPRTRNTS